MPEWGPGFQVSLDFYVNSLVPGNDQGYSWVFTIRNEENWFQYFYLTFSFKRDKDHSNGGDGIPAFYISDTGYLCVTFPLDNGLNSGPCNQENQVKIKTWYNLVVSSVMENSQVSTKIGEYKKYKHTFFVLS